MHANFLKPADLHHAIVRNPIIVSPETTAIEAIAYMSQAYSVCQIASNGEGETQNIYLESRSSCVFVVAEERLLGIFTDRDVVRLSADDRDLSNLTVQEVMSHPVISLRESALTDVFLAINLLQHHKIRHLAILDDRDRLCGMLTYESLLQLSSPIDLLQTGNVLTYLEQRIWQLEAENSQLVDNQPFKLQQEVAVPTAQQLQIELKERQKSEESLRRLNQDLESLVRQRSAELQERESQLRELFDNTTDLIQIVSLNGRILYVNRAWQQCLGYSETDLPHLSLFDLVHPDDVKSIYVLQQQPTSHPVESGSLSHNVEFRLQAKDGRSIIVEGNINFQFENHRPIAAHCILRNITARKEAESKLTATNHQLAIANAELARASELKDRFLASMSHELRTPLNAILGMSEGLQDEIFGAITDAQRRAINTIERSGNHLLELINDILDLAKIGAGDIELSLSPTEIDRLCQSSLSIVQQQAAKKGINLYLKSPTCLPNVAIDERRIRQVLLNLLSNAIKFTPPGGDVTLSVSIEPTPLVPAKAIPRDRWVRFAVADTGIGISNDDLERLFQPFFQIDSALNREYAGTGLGLALVKEIVEMHGGKVRVSSTLGVGSEFAIELPLQANTEPEAARDLTEISGNLSDCNAAILLVEDNAANVSTISNYLTAKGYRLMVANNGVEALDLLRSHTPDLVLMDIQMPEMDGIEAIERIREDSRLRSLPIIALTALAMAEDREKCLKVGANDYLSKPVKLKHLVTTIQKNLAPKEAVS